eukprot:TRINITY_DN7973_c0_g1_i1.p3 TRINITY_DN7973_c0_g1~~TRINITY_DN7973_c0_g1_i1.p3  ORF type:complete len:141 (+),score=43.59 TRINITY_DN7973_c0_g1_i1:890-1312(+)
MEIAVLSQLEFNLTVPTIKSFLRRYLKAAGANKETSMLAHYLCELTLQDYHFSYLYPPSLTGAVAVCLALHTNNLTVWTSTLEFYTQYKTSDPEFQKCLKDLYNIYKNAPTHSLQAVREKYASAKYQKISQLNGPGLYKQ